MRNYLFLLFFIFMLVSCEEKIELGDDVTTEGVHKDIDVFFAQTHVLQPENNLFKLVSNRASLIKAHVTSPIQAEAPLVKAILTLDGNSEEISLSGPEVLPESINILPGEVFHTFDDCFTGIIPKEWVQPGLVVEIQAGDETYTYDKLTIGAPNKVIMTMFDVHYFQHTPGDYPTGWQEELASKWPASEIELRRLNDVIFSELTIPPRGEYKAARVRSKQEYFELTGGTFDGEQAAALKWIDALRQAAGLSGRLSLFYLNIYGVPAGGQAGGYRGVGYGESIGILNHELGHALSLPHWGDNASYPYRGAMHGIPSPEVHGDVHVGPTWAFDMNKMLFIPPTVQPNSVGGVVGTYKKSPMQGGGTGDQERGFLMRHFSDYSEHKMNTYLERHIVVWNPELESYASWDDATQAYTKTVQNNGVSFPTEWDAEVISVMAGVSAVTPQANIIYPPIGPYTSGLIDLFDPDNESDRLRAYNVFCPVGGCDASLRITQGGTTKTVMLPIAMDPTADPLNGNSFITKAVNLRSDDGEITHVDLLYTPDAERNGLPENPEILYSWSK